MDSTTFLQDDFTQHQRDEISKSWVLMLDKIVHDLTTPLAIINMMGSTITNLLPDLTKAYRLAVEQHLVEPTIENRFLVVAEKKDSLNVCTQATELLKFLHLLHPLTKKLFLDNEAIQQVSVKKWLGDVLQNFSFENPSFLDLIDTDFSYDFDINRGFFFIDHLLSRLLEFTLEQKQETDKLNIKIFSQHTENYNIIRFKKLNSTISQEKILKKMEAFFLQKDEIILPDIGFCRLALLQLGGDVTCDFAENNGMDILIKMSKMKGC